jgi:hypothetical protein
LNGKQATGDYITALTSDVTASGPGSATATIANNVVTNAKLAQMGSNTIKGNNTGGAANAADLTVAQVNAILPDFIGDSGAGGTKGLVPAPASGDAAAGKYLKADGTWATTPGASATAYGVVYLNAASATTSSGNNTFAKITAFDTNGLSSNTTADVANDQITVTNTGIYEVIISGSASWPTNGAIMIFGVSVGGATPGTNAQLRLANPSNANSLPTGVTLSVILSLNAGNVLTLAANGPAGSLTVTYYTGFSMSVKRIA